jgi:hypothetical protein
MPKHNNKKDEGEPPDPPAPPPSALVTLLQKNYQVLKYVQSLQAYLDNGLVSTNNLQVSSEKQKVKRLHGSAKRRATKQSNRAEGEKEEAAVEPIAKSMEADRQ